TRVTRAAGTAAVPGVGLTPSLPLRVRQELYSLRPPSRNAAMPRVWPGRPYPLGATWDGAGVNFALFSENAAKVELCLFDTPDAPKETHRIELKEQTDQVWHCYLPDVHPGQLYGYRVHGPYEPAQGHRFNPHKLLLDPYAKLLGRDVKWDDSLFGYKIGQDDLSFDDRDNAPFAPLAVVVDTAFTWGDDRPPRTPWHKTLIYEAHVKGLTMRHSEVPENLRGTYAGLASESVIKHLQELNVTAIELLPVHHHLNERHLTDNGLTNYWGYSTLGFFAPYTGYDAPGNQLSPVHEFKMMVRALHAAGIEVILDVVYNHTAEGNQMGPTLSWRGIDNASYYRVSPDAPRYYMDFTGCGNTLNMQHPKVLQLIMDSLRYWATEMRVDGFRFDLASTLARELFEVNKLGAFFDIVHQDPILSQVKLIAEPWDVGPGGYQVGNFPPGWTEWNGKYRDNVRKYWKGDGGTAGEFATRLAGSSDLYERSGRKPYASINFVTCHDGFTLADLVSYDKKHNEANKEGNRDGTDNNDSWNCGHEGPTDDPKVNALRARQKRNFVATLMLSQGVPMLFAGDELSHTKQGNNNTYCQDNELSWLNWELTAEQTKFLAFVRRMTQLWREQPVLHRRTFFQGRSIRGEGVMDVSWFSPAGQDMSDDDWAGSIKCLGMRLAGDLIGELDERGDPIVGDTLLVLLNAHHEPIPFTLPPTKPEHRWECLFDTADDAAHSKTLSGGAVYPLRDRSVAAFRTSTPAADEPAVTPAQAEALRKEVRRSGPPADTRRG
ncbi:MAG TPA: glycogen debranching protein GlgX, partial [Fimbriiglobus sp.]|nr:glycogen debranching protein GlgX [Fimbriiglobus sp.]